MSPSPGSTPAVATPGQAEPQPMPTRVKIVATLGPASDAPEMVRKLIEAGVSVFRLNFSHGTLEQHAARLAIVRRVADELNRPVAVLGDLCGPKIRLGAVPPTPNPSAPDAEGSTRGLVLARGQEVVFTRSAEPAHIQSEPGSPSGSAVAVLPTTYPDMVDEVRPGQRVLINDGAVRLLAIERAPGVLRCRVTVGGLLTSGKGINLPDSTLSVPAITERDWECVAWAVRHGVDFLALSFVRTAGEVRLLKQRLANLCSVDRGSAGEPPAAEVSGHRALIAGATIPVVAKIEKPQGVANIDAILEAADAIMVARGDLGVEMDLAQVPVIQKELLAKAQAHGKPCIVATQMLETMVESTIPTRAEASDVANAVFEGADAVMLSGETAAGRHPALVVETMRRIVAAAETRVTSMPPVASPPAKWVESRYATAALAHGAWHVARDIGACLIVCWSQNGGTARYLSQQDFHAPIIAYTSSARAARRMALLKNVTPVRRDPPATLGAFTDMVEHDVLATGWVHRGDPILLLAGKPLGVPRATNSIATFTLGDPIGGYRSHKS